MMSIIYVFWMYVILFASDRRFTRLGQGIDRSIFRDYRISGKCSYASIPPPLEPNAMDIKNVELFWIRTIVLLVLDFLWISNGGNCASSGVQSQAGAVSVEWFSWCGCSAQSMAI